MPAPATGFGGTRPRERLVAFVAAAVVQVALGVALLSGFAVQVGRARDVVERLIDVRLLPPPPPQPPPPKPRPARATAAAAPPPLAPNPGGSPGPAPHGQAVTAPVAVIAAPPAGGGAGSGVSSGSGSGGGTGGQGYGEEDGGTDLVQIAGAILPSDYPRSLGNAGIGGRVSGTFTVETNGRVTECRVTHSSGVPQLDALTCRLMEERFRFRPSTDRFGRPIRDLVEWDHDWFAPRPR